jgi:hypothetical protein
MAARRLLIVMLILLGLSTLAAALVPTRPNEDEGTGSTIASEATESESSAADTVPPGKPLGLTIRVGKGPVKVVPIHVGDQLTLIVRSTRADQLEIPSLGLLETVAPGLPARFEVFARAKGSLGIRYVDADRLVARIQVQPPKKPKPKAGAKPAAKNRGP